MRLTLQQTITASWCAHYLQSRKVLVSVVWTTSSAALSNWTRHRPTAAAGRLHTITSRELGPVAHARPPSMAYAPLSPYDRPFPCHQTRPAKQQLDAAFLCLGPGDRQGLRFVAVVAKRNPTISATVSAQFVHNCLATYPRWMTTPLRLNSRQQTKRSFLYTATSLKEKPFHRLLHHHMHASRRAIPGFLYCFWGPHLIPAIITLDYYYTSH